MNTRRKKKLSDLINKNTGNYRYETVKNHPCFCFGKVTKREDRKTFDMDVGICKVVSVLVPGPKF